MAFYIYLPSNVKDVGEHENTLANYVTNLPKNLKFDEPYEVGLAEISYTNSWYNLLEPEFIRLVDPRNPYLLTKVGLTLPAGRYNQISEIVQSINEGAKKIYPEVFQQPPSLKFHPIKKT